MTSLAFMLELVPDPVWKTSMGNSPSCVPSTIASAAETMARACSCRTTPSAALAVAAAALTWASAWTCRGCSVRPLIGKFSIARWVWARHRASRGTSTSPIESCSVRVSVTRRPYPLSVLLRLRVLGERAGTANAPPAMGRAGGASRVGSAPGVDEQAVVAGAVVGEHDAEGERVGEGRDVGAGARADSHRDCGGDRQPVAGDGREETGGLEGVDPGSHAVGVGLGLRSGGGQHD